MRLIPILFLALFLGGCPPQQGQVDTSLSVQDFIKEMRSNDVHNIRREPNRRLTERTNAKAAYDVYINGQQVIVLELRPQQNVENLRGFFDGYRRQGYTLYDNANLVMVAREGLQEEVLQAFRDL